MTAGLLNIGGLLSVFILLAIVGVILRGVFLTTGKKPIRPSGREHSHDEYGAGTARGSDVGGGASSVDHGSTGGD